MSCIQLLISGCRLSGWPCQVDSCKFVSCQRVYFQVAGCSLSVWSYQLWTKIGCHFSCFQFVIRMLVFRYQVIHCLVVYYQLPNCPCQIVSYKFPVIDYRMLTYHLRRCQVVSFQVTRCRLPGWYVCYRLPGYWLPGGHGRRWLFVVILDR